MQVISALVPGGSIGQSRFICQILCSGMQGIPPLVPGRSIGQSRFICQVLHGGMQVISALVPGGSIGQSRFICQILCSGMQGIPPLVPGRSIGQSRFICQVLHSGMQVISALGLGGPSAKVGSSAKFCVVVCMLSLLWYWGGHQLKKVHLPSLVWQYSRHPFLITQGGCPSAKVGLSTKFGVAVFQTSMLDSWGVHLPKYVHLPSFVYWYSRQISPVRVEISYCHLGGGLGVLGVFWEC